MSKPWTAEWTNPVEDVARRIEWKFPRFAPAQVERLATGFDHDAFVVNRDWVFRFPRRRAALGQIELESRVLPQIESLLNLRIPAPRFVATDEHGRTFAGAELLPGREAARCALDDVQRTACAPAIAQFLKSLHSIRPVEIDGGLPGDELGRLVPHQQRENLLIRADRLGERLDSRERSVLHAILQFTCDADGGGGGARLVHGDFYSRHIFVINGRPAAVIDWGDLHAGGIAVDLAILFTFFPAGARATFLQIYGAVAPQILSLAQLRAAAHSLALLEYAIDVGDAGLEREARRIFQNEP